jgi:YVTN family beta-propeller protein
MFTKRLVNLVIIALVASMVILFPSATSTQAARGGPNQNNVYPDLNALNAASTSGKIAYVTFGGGSQIALVDTASHSTISTIDINQYGCNYAERVRLSPGGAYLYVFCPNDSLLVVLDTATNSLVATMSHPAWGNDVGFTQDGAYALVAERDQYQIDVIDTATFTVVNSIQTTWQPTDISVHPFLPLAYVSGYSCCYSGGVMVIDTTNFTVKADIPIPDDITTGVITSPDGKWVYASKYFGNPGIVRIDTTSNTIDATLPDLEGLYDLEIMKDGSLLFGASGWSNSVYIIDTNNFNVLTSIGTGGNTFNIVVTCDSRELYVGDSTDTVPVIDTQALSITYRIPIPTSGSNVIAVCPPGSSIHKFSSLNLQTLQINFGNKVKTDSIFIGGSFVLDPVSKGFDPTLDAVTVQVGKITAKLPPGSFVKKGQKFVFQGNIGGITYMEISQKHSGYDFNLQAQNLNLTDKFTNQVTFNLTVGKNTGSIKTRLQGSLNLVK